MEPDGEPGQAKRPRRRRLVRLGIWVLLVASVAGIALFFGGWRAYGKRPSGARLARMEKSPHWKDGHFVNPEPMENDLLGAALGVVSKSRYTTPDAPVDVQPVTARNFRIEPVTWLAVTWFGHSSFLVEIEGCRILIDPVWSDRISPVPIGPKRWYGPLIPLGELPHIDAVVISHDHYDHLDYGTVRAMKDWTGTTFVVPLGVGAHLEYWGIPPSRIVELDWWERTRVHGIELVATPARHISGRTFGIGDSGTLWSGWAMLGKLRRVYYSGDTGLFPGIKEIGDRLGPFDLTLVEAGEYGHWWSDWHLGPEQAVLAHQLVKGRVLIPAHWGLYTLAYHTWTEPIERVLVAAKKSGVKVAAPKPGQTIEPIAASPTERWWPVLPIKNAEADPIISTHTETISGGQ